MKPLVLQHIVRQDLERHPQEAKLREEARLRILREGFDLRRFGTAMRAFYRRPDPGPRGVSLTPIDDAAEIRSPYTIFAVGRFSNPFVTDIDEKKAMPNLFKGKTGAKLAQALRADGHDAVFVLLGGHLLEVIALDLEKIRLYDTFQAAKRAAR